MLLCDAGIDLDVPNLNPISPIQRGFQFADQEWTVHQSVYTRTPLRVHLETV